MKVEDGKIKPCSGCLKARQKVKDMAAKLSGRRVAGKQLIECDHCDVTTDARIIVAVSNEDFRGLIGTKVYLAGKTVMDVGRARPIGALGKIVKVSDITN